MGCKFFTVISLKFLSIKKITLTKIVCCIVCPSILINVSLLLYKSNYFDLLRGNYSKQDEIIQLTGVSERRKYVFIYT